MSEANGSTVIGKFAAKNRKSVDSAAASMSPHQFATRFEDGLVSFAQQEGHSLTSNAARAELRKLQTEIVR